MFRKNILLVLVSLTITVSGLFAGVKSVATVTGIDKCITLRLPAPYNEDAYAGTFKALIDGNTTSLYCIDIKHELKYNDAYNDVEKTNDTLSYILNNYYPYKQSYTGILNPVEKEAGAVQLALWHFTDGLDISKVTKVDNDVITRALAIVADALTNERSFSLKTFSIVIPPQTFASGTPVTFSVQAFNEKGLAMANVQIALTTTAGVLSSTSVTTGIDGVTPAITLTPSGSITTATITAKGVVGIPSGTKYYNTADPDGKQKIILAKPTTASRSITSIVNWSEPIKLTVNKTADKTTVNNGDVVNYTIKVTNAGAAKAQAVQVSDQLQTTLKYVSSTSGQIFDAATGIWSVGDINAGETKTIVVTTKAVYGTDGANFNLGIAKDYNLFVIDTLSQPSSDTEGKVAVGGYADLKNYSVGDKLAANSGAVLVVGGHLHFLTGRVYNGKAIYGNYITSTTAFSADDSIYQNSGVVDFSTAKIYLEDLSQQLSLISDNGAQTLEYGELALTGTDSKLNTFTVDGSKLSKINNFTINAPANSTVLVNITGDVTSWSGGFSVTGTTRENVMLNFTNCAYLKFSNIEINASILAPKTRIYFPNGLVTGQVIAKCLFGSGQINYVTFNGKVTGSKTIANVATLISANQCNMQVSFNTNPSAAVVYASNSVTSVKSASSAAPVEYKLQQNYPNPFNPSTSIAFSIAKNDMVSLVVYDITGRIVKTLVNSELPAGSYSVKFNADNLGSGIYFTRLTTSSYSATRKMILMK